MHSFCDRMEERSAALVVFIKWGSYYKYTDDIAAARTLIGSMSLQEAMETARSLQLDYVCFILQDVHQLITESKKAQPCEKKLNQK